MIDLRNEVWFASKDRVVLGTVLAAFLLATLSILAGLHTIKEQRALIDHLETVVTEDRDYVLSQQSDVGSAAYYAFHLTYDQPSSLAFASLGVRNELPWKHRIRMLALEGQIYESDTGNPELSLGGKLDFAFVASVLVPIFLIILLHDSRSSEVRGRRYELLLSTRREGDLFFLRASVRAVLLFLALAVPFILGSAFSGASIGGSFLVLGALAFNIVFWMAACLFAAKWVGSGPTVAASLLGLWLVAALALPMAGKILVEAANPLPEGGELLLTQREAVNDAWDLPKSATMDPFIERHPEWASRRDAIMEPFDWKWYYAFQQVGDQTVEPLSEALRVGIDSRDHQMAWVALLSPTLLTERLMNKAAKTDIAAYQHYEACVRAFHADLREFHYPMLFGAQEYSTEAMQALPHFAPCSE